MIKRCDWAETNELLRKYHDDEWGVPLHDDQRLFELLILEGFQAGLSWNIILKKREFFKDAFYDFDPYKISGIGASYVNTLMNNPNLIRNYSKITSVISNAIAFINIQKNVGSFDQYIWDFVDGKTIQNSWESMNQIPTSTPLSEKISRDLKQRGFKFVGPTICYAFLEAIGLINDHLVYCFRNKELYQ